MNKYEQLIEHIINEDEQSAKELFHQLVVEKSRDIYESLMDEEIGGNQTQDFVQDITNQNDSAQDQGLGEDDEDMDLGSDDEIGTDGDDMDDMDDMDHEETFGGDDMEAGEEGEHQDRCDRITRCTEEAQVRRMGGGRRPIPIGFEIQVSMGIASLHPSCVLLNGIATPASCRWPSPPSPSAQVPF